jgi:hypothetical protein
VGNGELYAATRAQLGTYTGVTISRPELDHFGKRFKDAANARTLLANKHDERLLPSIGGNFDLIVDVNLKSFACCERHFRTTMLFFAGSLTSRGKLITAQSGLEFGWAGNTATAHTPGADTNPAVSAHRLLGVKGLTNVSQELGLTLRNVAVKGTSECNAEMLWVLGRA